MNGTSGFQEVRSSTSDHQQIGSWTSNNINLGQVLGTFSVLTIPSLPLQTSYRAEKTPVTQFSEPRISGFESHLNGTVRGTAIPSQPGGHR